MRKPLLYLMLSLYLMVQTVYAYTITVDLTWGFDPSNPMGEGSIVQVIGWNTSNANPPPNNASGNFDQLGTYEGQPTYDYASTPDNHHIISELALQENSAGYFVFQQFIIQEYNRIYVRFFSDTNLSNYEVELSYWGLTVSRPLTGNTNRTIVLMYANLNPANQNYFGAPQPYFEVIPEPSSFSLLILGFLFLKYTRKR